MRRGFTGKDQARWGVPRYGRNLMTHTRLGFLLGVTAMLGGCRVASDIATSAEGGAKGETAAAGASQHSVADSRGGAESAGPEGITCGSGTVLRGDQCVADKDTPSSPRENTTSR